MSGREAGFALVLLVAAGLIVVGTWQVFEPAAWIVGGVLLGFVGWLVLSGPR